VQQDDRPAGAEAQVAELAAVDDGVAEVLLPPPSFRISGRWSGLVHGATFLEQDRPAILLDPSADVEQLAGGWPP